MLATVAISTNDSQT